jgi:hypothetical protein
LEVAAQVSLERDNDRAKREYYVELNTRAEHERHNPAPFRNAHVHIGRNHNAPPLRLGEDNSASS